MKDALKFLAENLSRIWIKPPFPIDSQEGMDEAARLYKLNHNRERANKEWKFLDDFCGKVYKNYCKLWGCK